MNFQDIEDKLSIERSNMDALSFIICILLALVIARLLKILIGLTEFIEQLIICRIFLPIKNVYLSFKKELTWKDYMEDFEELENTLCKNNNNKESE